MIAAILLAAGRGLRAGQGQNKVLSPLLGEPVLHWSLRCLAQEERIEEIVIMAAAGELEQCRIIAAPFAKVQAVLPGGNTRQRSVLAGLLALNPQADLVLIHDGARPLLTPRDLKAVLAAATPLCGAILATPVKDTIKRGAGGLINATLLREELFAAQTPQIFARGVLVEASLRAESEDYQASDDAALVEYYGGQARLVLAQDENEKLTLPQDFILAELILRQRIKDEQKRQSKLKLKPIEQGLPGRRFHRS